MLTHALHPRILPLPFRRPSRSPYAPRWLTAPQTGTRSLFAVGSAEGAVAREVKKEQRAALRMGDVLEVDGYKRRNSAKVREGRRRPRRADGMGGVGRAGVECRLPPRVVRGSCAAGLVSACVVIVSY